MLHTNRDFAWGYAAQVPSAVAGTVLGKIRDANSRYSPNDTGGRGGANLASLGFWPTSSASKQIRKNVPQGKNEMH